MIAKYNDIVWFNKTLLLSVLSFLRETANLLDVNTLNVVNITKPLTNKISAPANTVIPTVTFWKQNLHLKILCTNIWLLIKAISTLTQL